MNTILFNGKIYIDRGRFEEAVFIKDSVIQKVGSNEEILKMHEVDEKIDCKGNTVIPGLNDSHLHMLNFGERMCQAEIGSCKTID